MQFKTYSLILLLASLLLIAGCTSGGNSSDIDYRTGSQALEMVLLNPAVEDYYEGEVANILVEYYNRGTADIVNGEFFVSGYDLKYTTLYLDPKYITADGKSEYDPNGDFSQILSIKSSALEMPKNSEEFPQTVKITACYKYSSLASAEICVDPDPNSRRVSSKICTMGTVSPGPQGGPIVVTSVEPLVSKDDFRLNIEIANQGDGVVYDKDISNQECFLALDKYEDKDLVDLIKVDFSGKTMTCQPKNPIRLIDGRGKITCECKGCLNSYVDAYKTQIAIQLNYGYRNEVLKNIRILSD